MQTINNNWGVYLIDATHSLEISIEVELDQISNHDSVS